jgi:hypothetical protein
MASITKTQGISLLSLQQIAGNSVSISSVQDVTTKLAATIFIHLGRDDTSGALSNGVEFRIEASAKASGDDQWFTLMKFRSNVTVPESEALTGTITSTATSLTLSSTTNLSVGQIILVKNSVLANSEFARIKSVSTNASVSIIDGLTNTQTGSTIYNQGEMFTAQLDLTAVGRIRLVADASSTGKTIVVEAFMVTGDTIG